MNQASNALSIAGEFPPATHEQWLKLVEGVLKGGSFDRKLVHTTADGLRIDPLYQRRSDARPLAGRGAAPWQVVQRVDHPDPAKANAQALDDLENGATGLLLVFGGGPSAYGYGLEGSDTAIARALDGVYLDGVAIETDLSPQFKDAGHLLAALVKQRGHSPDAVSIRFNYDPICAKAVAGASPLPWSALAPLFVSIVRSLSDQGFKGPFAAANGQPIHAAGGSEAQELAFVIADGLAYLRALEAGGIALDAARRMIYFRLAADADQFMTMAKFRALRKLWARAEEACGLTPVPAFVSAETAWRMMTQRDLYVNMLRTTIAAFAAGLGGADAVSVLPHTIALGLPDGFARRIARNTQLILLEESNLARVADPAAGSGGIEHLTDDLCRAAWTLFQEIEAAGGAAEAVESGLIQQKVAAVRKQRQAAIAQRKDALTGTSDYPNLSELPGVVLDVKRVAVPPLPASKGFPALPLIRLAEPFEALRDASDAMLAKTGARPKVLLAELGSPADFTARAIFARNFFEAGGIEAVGHSTTGARPAAALKSSGAQFACLCSSDEVYAKEAPAVARALQDAGAKRVYLAGRPGAIETELTQAGVNTFVYSGCDALATLREAHDILGIGTVSETG
jgi:methylmalonyl-CoA mutase